MALAKEQQGAIEDLGVGPTRRQLSDEQISFRQKPGLQTPECLLLLLSLYMLVTAIFFCYLAWCEWMWGDLQRL